MKKDGKADLVKNMAAEVIATVYPSDTYFVEEAVLLARVTDLEGHRTAAIMSTMEHDHRGLLGLLRAEVLRVELLLEHAIAYEYWGHKPDEDNDEE